MAGCRKWIVGMGSACVVTLGLAASAMGQSAYDRVFDDYQRDGRVTPCLYSASTLDQVLAQIPRDTDSYNPDFRTVVTAERDRVRAGRCGTSAGAPARLRIVRVAARSDVVTIRNSGSVRVRLRGWSVANGRNRFYSFRRGALAPRRSLRLRSGRGRDRGATYFWRTRSRNHWRNGGDVAKLFAPGRRLVQRFRYGSFR